MAEHGIVELYQRIQQLESANGMGENAADKPSEVFRLWGLIDWILQLEGNWILEEMEDRQLALSVREGLLQAKEALNQAAIVPIRIPKVPKLDAEDPTEFHKYMELPGPVVRQNILRFLCSEDLLSMARAKPSEAQYIKPPLSHIQMEAVFPLLMDRELLEEKDVQNLSLVDPFFQAFIVKRLENVEWKGCSLYDGMTSDIRDVVLLKHLPQDQGEYPFCHPVLIELCKETEFIMAHLQSVGKRILNAVIRETDDEELEPEDVFGKLVPCLRLLPNLKALCIYDSFWIEEDDSVKPEVLPELPHLRILYMCADSDFGEIFVEKYGGQLEWLHMLTGLEQGPPQGFPVLPEGAVLSTLQLVEADDFSDPPVLLPPLGVLNNFAQCPLKQLYIYVHQVPLDNLLREIGKLFGNTLEALEVMNETMERTFDYPKPENPVWMLNLRFPKVRRLILSGYPWEMSWSFLLLFPALEKLENSYWPYSDEDEEQNTKHLPESMIMLYKDGNLCARNIWKVLPTLKKIIGNQHETILREDCIDIQNRI